MGRRKGCTNSQEHNARISAKAQEYAYWSRIFTHVRRAADAGDERQAVRLLRAYLRERREKEAA